MKRIFALWALACGFLPAVWAQPNGVTADLQLDRIEFLTDEDLIIKVHIENRSGQELHLGGGNDWINFTVTGGNGAPVQPLGNGTISNEFFVESAQQVDVKFNLTPFFNFRSPGRYTVKAAFKIPQWNQEVTCRPVSFTVIEGLRLSNVPDVAVGVPSAITNAPPEMRRYFLEKVTGTNGMKLYFRLTDGSGEKTFRTFPLGMMVSFSDPQAQIDRLSNLHVLNQSGARTFTYTVLDPHGFILDRQTYLQTDTRPELRSDAAGGIVVGGGTRRLTDSDIPPSGHASTTAPATAGRGAP